uniref:Uncharacterized protein n=1 Tax=Rhizophora mucronata TaxID=61149 RepID=A0A2P2NX48_RHIMU
MKDLLVAVQGWKHCKLPAHLCSSIVTECFLNLLHFHFH